jgi:ubiquinone/menaquinone biosynthesis C-methylase UbiE
VQLEQKRQMENQKRRQVEYHEKEHYHARVPRHADNSNPLIAWLNYYRLRKMMEMIGTPLAGKTVLSVCGGDGEEADFLQKLGAEVTVTDLSASGVEAARLRNPALRCLCMDAESLAFADRSFDWAIVREGLHHLARPVKGLYELERVSREGFAILEGQDSLIVRLLLRLGLGENRDPAGGCVYRFSRREIQKIFFSVQTLADWRIHTAWLPFGSDALKYFPIVRRLVYPVINQPLILRILTGRLGRCILKALFLGVNLLAGRWGNCLIAIAWKKPPRHPLRVRAQF